MGRVRSALQRTTRLPAADIPRDYARSRPSPDVVELFCARVADYRATVQRVTGADLPAAIAESVRATGARSTATPGEVPQEWCQALQAEFAHVAGEPEAADLDRIDAVATAAAVGIATTGTIVLDHGADQGRRALTLVPDVHVCVVREAQIVDDVPAALARLDPARPTTFISGPSATSDIELKRVEGVHGPRTLHVLVAAD
nr:lactate utilization protein C [Saccharopolyspora sp. HNM0983]